MGKDILHRVGNGGHCGCETVSREVLPQVEIPEKWTQEPPCFAITIWCAILSHTKQGHDSIEIFAPKVCSVASDIANGDTSVQNSIKKSCQSCCIGS